MSPSEAPAERSASAASSQINRVDVDTYPRTPGTQRVDDGPERHAGIIKVAALEQPPCPVSLLCRAHERRERPDFLQKKFFLGVTALGLDRDELSNRWETESLPSTQLCS